MKFAIDAMGGDFAPYSAVKGSLDAIKYSSKDLYICLLGDETAIKRILGDNYPKEIQVIHTDEIVTMDEKASKVLKSKPNSSMVRGIQMVKDNLADGFISAGHTGAILSVSLLSLGRIPGVMRPALAAYFPTEGRGKILCDVGANPDAKPKHLSQFALMASHYYDHVEGFPNPKIGLVNIGSESNKGSDLYVETYSLLSKIPNFIGNVEGRQLLNSEADVLICDGFVGNTILKFSESLFSFFTNEIEEKIQQKLFYRIGAKLMQPVFKSLKNRYDYEEHGGVPLLGVNGISIVCHGSSGSKSIMNSIFLAQKCIENNLISDTQKSLSKNLENNSES
tara:strand:- start:1189 stop:2196 length:1008 start_codon:yes stop_codon:yes gene_type:complete